MRYLSSLLIVASLTLSTPAWAVVILDATWEAEGGSEAAWGEGFGSARALAAEPQFDAVVGLEGSFSGDVHFGCSSTWLGNSEDGNAFLLSAAHCFNANLDPSVWDYVTGAGTYLQAKTITRHPLYDDDRDETGGYDMAIVELNGPIDDSGEPPVLYAGSDELSRVATMVGFGTRGTAAYGEDRKFNSTTDKAAAHNVIDIASEPEGEGDGGNLLQTDFDGPDGEGNTLEGDAAPVDALEGMIALGDSGGSLWIETEDGWRIAGVNVASDVMSGYGMIDDFARVSTQLDWIKSIFPDAQTGE